MMIGLAKLNMNPGWACYVHNLCSRIWYVPHADTADTTNGRTPHESKAH